MFDRPWRIWKSLSWLMAGTRGSCEVGKCSELRKGKRKCYHGMFAAVAACPLSMEMLCSGLSPVGEEKRKLGSVPRF